MTTPVPVAARRPSRAMMPSRWNGSRLATGSSSSSQRGRATRARASSTRARSPVDNVSTRRSANASASTAMSAAVMAASSRAAPGPRPNCTRSAARIGQATSRSAGNHASVRTRVAAASGAPSMVTVPGPADRPAMARSSVVLPAPLGPISPVTLAGGKASVTGASSGGRARLVMASVIGCVPPATGRRARRAAPSAPRASIPGH